MSDQSQGPGWWLASDGKWYSPEQAPPVPPVQTWATPPGPPPKRGMSTGVIVALAVGGVVGVLILLGVAVTFLGTEASKTFEETGEPIVGDDGPVTTDSTELEPIEVPEGFEIFAGDGVSMAAPAEWTLLDPDDADMTSEEFAAAFPDAPPEMVDQGLDMFAQGAVLVAIDLTDASFSSNVNIIEVPGEAPLGVVQRQAEGELESIGAEIVDSAAVEVAAGEAVRIEYELAVNAADGSVVEASGVQYYLPFDGHTYVITVSSGADAAAVADRAIDTFRVG